MMLACSAPCGEENWLLCSNLKICVGGNRRSDSTEVKANDSGMMNFLLPKIKKKVIWTWMILFFWFEKSHQKTQTCHDPFDGWFRNCHRQGNTILVIIILLTFIYVSCLTCTIAVIVLYIYNLIKKKSGVEWGESTWLGEWALIFEEGPRGAQRGFVHFFICVQRFSIFLFASLINLGNNLIPSHVLFRITHLFIPLPSTRGRLRLNLISEF